MRKGRQTSGIIFWLCVAAAVGIVVGLGMFELGRWLCTLIFTLP